MSETKALFQKNKDLRDWLIAITKHDNFKLCLAYTKASLMDYPKVTSDMLDGARLFETLLLNLPETEDETGDFPNPGLDHSVPLTVHPKTKPEPKQ